MFPILRHCSIVFPHHAGTIQPLRPVIMPSCQEFEYGSNDLSPLQHFDLSKMRMLDVKCGQWSVWRGNLQLITVHSLVAASSQSLTALHLDIQCSEQLLVCVLGLVPTLQQLQLRLARPNALTKAFFQAFILRHPDDIAPKTFGLQKQVIGPLCPSLQLLYLQYRRWPRGIDNKKLIPLFSDIVASRQWGKSLFSFSLDFDERHNPSVWSVGMPVRKIQKGNCTVTVGILCPHGIIPMSTQFSGRGILPLPFKEVDYLYLHDSDHNTPIDFHFTLDHMELSKCGPDQPILLTSIPRNLPLFCALRVLMVEDINPSFLAGHTFHGLERCSVMGSSKIHCIESQKLLTEMPVCTRIDIGDPALLAMFKLPQLRELGLDFSLPESTMIWIKHISLNSNLSGLKLLHIWGKGISGDLTQVFESLPLLETLIISSQVDVNTFRALNKLHWEGPISAILCPMLKWLKIEGTDPSGNPELTDFLKEVVNLRAECGSGLKSFTFYIFGFGTWKIELIGVDGYFTMEKTLLAEDTEPFELDI